MAIFLDTRGRTKVAIGICGRCSVKLPYDELHQDPNYPGIWVCADDLDQFDPYRLPARETENITLDHPRPDVDISTQAPTPAVVIPPVDGINKIGFVSPWQANTPYLENSSATPQDINNPAFDLPQQWLVCIVAGTSGAHAPAWPTTAGVKVTDGTVTWLSYGIYPN